MSGTTICTEALADTRWLTRYRATDGRRFPLLDDLIDAIDESADYAEFTGPIIEYRRRYGVGA